MTTTAQEIAEARMARGWTQEQLADAAEVSHSAVWRAEAGETKKGPAITAMKKVLGLIKGGPAIPDELSGRMNILAQVASLPPEQMDALRALLNAQDTPRPATAGRFSEPPKVFPLSVREHVIPRITHEVDVPPESRLKVVLALCERMEESELVVLESRVASLIGTKRAKAKAGKKP